MKAQRMGGEQNRIRGLQESSLKCESHRMAAQSPIIAQTVTPANSKLRPHRRFKAAKIRYSDRLVLNASSLRLTDALFSFRLNFPTSGFLRNLSGRLPQHTHRFSSEISCRARQRCAEWSCAGSIRGPAHPSQKRHRLAGYVVHSCRAMVDLRRMSFSIWRSRAGCRLRGSLSKTGPSRFRVPRRGPVMQSDSSGPKAPQPLEVQGGVLRIA